MSNIVEDMLETYGARAATRDQTVASLVSAAWHDWFVFMFHSRLVMPSWSSIWRGRALTKRVFGYTLKWSSYTVSEKKLFVDSYLTGWEMRRDGASRP